MNFYTKVGNHQVELNFIVPENTLRVSSYYFKRCLLQFNTSHMNNDAPSVSEDKLAATITNAFAESVSEGTINHAEDTLIYALQLKKSRGFRSLENFEPTVEAQVGHLLEPLATEQELLSRLISIELVIDAIHGGR